MASRIRLSKVFSCFNEGPAGVLSEIEISQSPGIPTFDVIGLCDSSIRESRGRIISALNSSGFIMPKGHITVSISPSYMRKSGTSFDLPIAIGILLVSGQINCPPGVKIYAEGELKLTGETRGTPGSAVRLRSIDKDMFDHIIVPEEERESAVFTGSDAAVIGSLKDITDVIAGRSFSPLTATSEAERNDEELINGNAPDLSVLKGQEKTKRALILAASGFHNILLLGSPGCGKTLAAGMISSIMPPLSPEEQRDVYALSDLTGSASRERPFRTIGPGTALSKITGSSSTLIPGEAVLADHGILFADEICEMKNEVLDGLRLPMGEHEIRHIKDGKVFRFPARFLFVGSGNPCRCGNRFEKDKVCRCTPSVISRYLSKLSGAFLDRIDIFSEMRSLDAEDLKSTLGRRTGDESRRAQETVRRAWDLQKNRYSGDSGNRFNGIREVSSDEDIFDIIRASEEVREYAVETAGRYELSARGMTRMILLGRTIADTEGRQDMKVSDIAEAGAYRSRDLIRR